MAFDDMLSLFSVGKLICVGYADDGCLLITGKNLPLMYKLINEALEKCQRWAESYRLSISPEKTEYMLCTRQKSKSYSIPTSGIMIKGERIRISKVPRTHD